MAKGSCTLDAAWPQFQFPGGLVDGTAAVGGDPRRPLYRLCFVPLRTPAPQVKSTKQGPSPSSYTPFVRLDRRSAPCWPGAATTHGLLPRKLITTFDFRSAGRLSVLFRPVRAWKQVASGLLQSQFHAATGCHGLNTARRSRSLFCCFWGSSRKIAGQENCG